MKFGMVVNDVDTESATYSSTRLALTAARRGHEVWYMGVGDFVYEPHERLSARARRASAEALETTGRRAELESFLSRVRGEPDRRESLDVEGLDALWLRNDPAEDALDRPWAQNMGTVVGDLAAERGVLVLNDPGGLAKAANKLYFQRFPAGVRPETLVTREPDEVRTFVADHGGRAVLKPLQGSGGEGVFLIQPGAEPNINQMVDADSRFGYVAVQEYLPAAAEGDVRLLLIDGRPIAVDGTHVAFRRVQTSEDMRSNMRAGGEIRGARVDDAMLELAERVRPRLVADGMFLVGLDVVGHHLMEINVFSPGGFGGFERMTGIDSTPLAIDALERKVRRGREHPGLTNCQLATS